MTHAVQFNDAVKSKCNCEHCREQDPKPYRIITHCPKCGRQHIDEGPWATKLHKVHRCVDRVEKTVEAGEPTISMGCGFEWQPALVFTVGVLSLPLDHRDHGRGDASGPDVSDCACRNTDYEAICAAAGCGFCKVSPS